MRHLSLIPPLVIALALIASLANCGGTRTENVSAATIAALPAGKALDIDLTRRGTLYQVETAGTDLNRVAVRTAAGTRTLGELLKISDANVGRGLLLGRPDDFNKNFPPSIQPSATGVAKYDCGAVSCKCETTFDCLDMILDGKCAGEFWCSTQTSNCYCIAKP